MPVLPVNLIADAWHPDQTEKFSRLKILGAASSNLVFLAVRASPHGVHPYQATVHRIHTQSTVGEPLAGKTEVELLVGVRQVGHPTRMPTAKPQLGVLTRKHPTLMTVERHRHGIPRLERPIPMATVAGRLDGMRAREHQILTLKEDVPLAGMPVHGRLIRIPTQIRTRMLLVQARVGVNLRAALLQAGSNHRELLITMVGVIQQPRTSGSVSLTCLGDLCSLLYSFVGQ